MTTDVETLGAQMLEAVKGYIARAIAPLRQRIETFEQKVAAIPAGPPGRDGRDAMAARDGQDGRDAAQLDPLDAIDETRSYPRGTWARHQGGLIRSSRQTDTVKDGGILNAGWVVMVEGVAGFAVTDGEDVREIVVAAMLTSGMKMITTFRLPVLIYREIFKEGESYEPGDVVTHGGSAWHCQTPTKASPVISPSAWRLMVKSGREGAIGKDGKPGERGKDGRDGRDLTQLDPTTGKKW